MSRGDSVEGRELRALIRGAVKAHILTGWYWYTAPDGSRRYILAPPQGKCLDYSVAETERYCQMLAEAGVEPYYQKVTMQ